MMILTFKLLRFQINIITGMGNQNHYRNPEFINAYSQLQKEFTQATPLFDVKDIKFPLSTKNMKIVDATGRRVKIAGANWSGGHMKRHCVGGLDRRPLNELCKDIRTKFGMNCVRLTFSLQLLRDNNVIDNSLISKNPNLFKKTALQIFDQTIKALTNEGLMVYLNNHTSKSQWCCDDYDGDGLWWNTEYNEEYFFECLRKLTQRYKHNQRVIGIDLRNQIRKSPHGNPTWGDGNKQTDWHMAAENIGNQIQKIAPHWLIIVGGINYQLDLTGVHQHPIRLNIPNKLVYTGHFYGFSWGPDMIWSIMSEEWFRQKLYNQQLFVRKLGVPFLFGEFGNNCRNEPWIYFVKYVKELDLDWTYWCLDGYKCDKQQQQTFGLWDYQFQKPRHPQLLQDLFKIGRPTKRTNN